MNIGLFATKVGMTQVFDTSGTLLPVTILKIGLCRVYQIKTVTVNGYNAVQVAYGEEKLENTNKATQGRLKKIGDRGFKYFGEFHITEPENYKLGQTISLDTFSVDVSVRLIASIIN